MISATHETLADLLDRYGCSENEDGWRRLAILLAIEAKKIERPKYVPAVRIEHQFQALIEEAARNGGAQSKTAAAQSNADWLRRHGDDRREAESLRVQASTSARQTREAQAAGRWSDDELRSVGASKDGQLSSSQLALLAPDTMAGQARLDSAFLASLERAARHLTHDASGKYLLPNPVPVDDRRAIIAIVIRRSARSQPRNVAPLEGRHMAAVKLLIREEVVGGGFRDELLLPDECTHIRERVDCLGTDFECSLQQDSDGKAPQLAGDCMHERESVEFRAALDCGTIVQLNGFISDEMGPSPCIDAVFVITPLRNRRHVASYTAIPRAAL